MHRFFWITALLISIVFTNTVIASPPVPSKKSDALGYDQQLKSAKQSQTDLKAKAKNIEKDLNKTQKNLVNVADDIRKNERELSKLDKEIGKLQSQKQQAEKRLQKDKGAISDLILALERIRRVPPEALIVKPDAPLKTAQSAMLLQNILPSIHEQAESLKIELEKLEDVSKKLESEKSKLKKASDTLKTQQTKMRTLLSSRKKLYASTQTDIKEREARIKKISSKAKNLRDLVQRLDDEKQRTANYNKTNVSLKKPILTQPNLKNIKPGSPRLPITGAIKTHYNQPDNFGAPSQGIDIEGRGGALVVAPMGGIVKFAGAFKNYGQMVIIEHQGNYHSLVAGLEKIDTVVGQKLAAGEPLGTLHYASGQDKPLLYFEFRHKGKPIDPARKFSDL